MAQLRALEASGGITRLGAAQVEAALHAKEHAAALAVLQAELDQLERAATKGKNPITGQEEYTEPKQAADIQRVRNQISQQKGKGAAQGITDASAIQQQIVAPYKKAFDTIASDFNSTVLSILRTRWRRVRRLCCSLARSTWRTICLWTRCTWARRRRRRPSTPLRTRRSSLRRLRPTRPRC